MIDLQFESNGGSIKYGSGNPNDSIHWYHVYDPNNLYRGGNVPNNCYVQNWHGGQYGDCGIVYDALGGARRAYTVRTGFWQNSQGNGWAQLTGPTSSLGMPLTNEYETDPGYAARQDFVGGWLNWVSGVCGMHTWPVCSPGWTTDGWNPTVSYRIAEIYEANGAWTHFGSPTGKAYAVMDGWEQVFDNDVIFVPNDYLVGGQGGPEIGPVDLVSVFGADSCDLSVQTWFQNDPGPSYSFSGMDGWKHFEPPACYNTWLVRRAVVMDIDSDGDGDLLNCFDYGNNETRFHAFLQDSENLEFDYQGDAGVWHVGGQWGGSYNAQSVKHLVQADLNNDTHPDLIGLYDYGSCQTRFHAWLRHSSTSNYLYQGDGGYWHVGGPYGGSYCASSVKFLVPVNLNGDTYTDLIAAYDYGNNETRFHRFTFNYANHYYTYGGDAGVWHAGGQWGGSYDLNSVKFLVPVKLNDDQYTDLIAAYDYGSGQTRFHAFLWNSSTGKYVHQGDGGYWHMGGPYGGSYPLANLLFLEPVDANGDQYTDLIGAYKYGTNEVRFHSWVYDAANHEYDYYSDNGVWSSASYLAAGMKFLRSAEAPWRNVVMGRQSDESGDEQFADHVPHIGDPAALPFARAEVSVVNSPSSGPVRLVYSLSMASEGVLSIHNVVGRKILSCTVPPSSEPQEFLWDCRDDTGNKVPAGVYFVGLTSSNLSSTRKIVLVR